MKTERNFTISKMSQTNGKYFLWAVIDEFGHTMVQVWDEKEPTDVVTDFGGILETKSERGVI